MPQKPEHPDPDANTGFLQRWSDRKTNATEQTPTETGPDTISTDPAIGPQDQTGSLDIEPTDDIAAAEAPTITEADLENLTYDSDYTKFMGENVPEALRRRALRQLWRSDPILANVDGLCDYDDDYTDAALAVKVLKTAHRIGQGFLTDDDVAANRARGEPKSTEETGNDFEHEDGSEEIESDDDEEFNEVVTAATSTPDAESVDATSSTFAEPADLQSSDETVTDRKKQS